MDDQGKSDHWDLLASSLGATPAESEGKPDEATPAPQDELQGEAASAPAPEAQEEDVLATLPQSTHSPAPVEKRKTPQDWAKLAGELGIEVPPDSFALPEETVVSTAVDLAETPPIVVTTLEPAAEWESAEEGAGAASGDERGRKRRKRRRRGARRSEVEEVLPEIQDAEFDESPEIPRQPAESRGDFDDVLAFPDDVAERAGAEPAAEEESLERAKRRRRRRKKTARRHVEAGQAELAESRERVESIEERAFDADDVQLAGSGLDEGDDEDEPGHHEERALHRAIPTWQEAVNLVIAANLDARAKAPDRRSSHRPRGRGGRSD